MMNSFPYALRHDTRPMLGLISLQTDETIEDDLRRLFPSGTVRLHVTRIPSGADVSPETLNAMAHDLPAAAALLPPSVTFASVGYGCTSGATMIGADKVADLVKKGTKTDLVTNPLTATIAAFEALGTRRIGLITPYIPSVTEPMRQAFITSGFEVPHVLSFGEENEAKVARIDGASITAAAQEVASRGGIDALFLSCTNLRALDELETIESETGLPALCSNLSLGWHMAKQAATQIAGPWSIAKL